MTSPRSYHTSTLLSDGRVLLTGGVLSSGQQSKTAEFYDPATGLFTQATRQMKIGRGKHTANLLGDGGVLIVGGKSAEVFDPATQIFTATLNSPTNRTNQSAVNLTD